jgi:hypothetical protein
MKSDASSFGTGSPIARKSCRRRCGTIVGCISSGTWRTMCPPGRSARQHSAMAPGTAVGFRQQSTPNESSRSTDRSGNGRKFPSATMRSRLGRPRRLGTPRSNRPLFGSTTSARSNEPRGWILNSSTAPIPTPPPTSTKRPADGAWSGSSSSERRILRPRPRGADRPADSAPPRDERDQTTASLGGDGPDLGLAMRLGTPHAMPTLETPATAGWLNACVLLSRPGALRRRGAGRRVPRVSTVPISDNG